MRTDSVQQRCPPDESMHRFVAYDTPRIGLETHAAPGPGYVSDPTLGTCIDVSHAGRSASIGESPKTELQGDRRADEDQRGPGERRVDRRKVAGAEICRHGCPRGFVSALCRIPRDSEGLDVGSRPDRGTERGMQRAGDPWHAGDGYETGNKGRRDQRSHHPSIFGRSSDAEPTTSVICTGAIRRQDRRTPSPLDPCPDDARISP